MENQNKPAYPVLLRQIGEDKFRIASEKDSREGMFLSSELGLTKREYFAASAMRGVVSNQEFLKNLNAEPDLVVDAILEITDKLLKKLSETNEHKNK